jgi:hypothetical protein
MSSEAVAQLGLEPGVLAVAVIESTNVVIETPPERTNSVGVSALLGARSDRCAGDRRSMR